MICVVTYQLNSVFAICCVPPTPTPPGLLSSPQRTFFLHSKVSFEIFLMLLRELELPIRTESEGCGRQVHQSNEEGEPIGC